MPVSQRKVSSKKKNAENKEDNKEKAAAKEVQRTAFSAKIPWRKVVSRICLSLLMIFAVYWTSKKEDYHVFASQKDRLQINSAEVPCSSSYLKDISKFKECSPKRCGRLVTDIVVSPQETTRLLQMVKKGLAFGGSSGGASILDLHSGALSYENSFINIYEKLKHHGKKNIFTDEDFKVYSKVRTKIQQVVAYNFGIPFTNLHLTHPTFFSEMTPQTPRTKHDEYWHVHVDKETYPSFHYTSLLYLSDYETDFTGGRFIFISKGKNITIEPRTGRISAFTSGAENPHHVERVNSGTRYALTVSFTCDPKLAIADPTTKKFQ